MKRRTHRQTHSGQRADTQLKSHSSNRMDAITSATAGMIGAVLASSAFVTADGSSVFDGDSLPQVLAILAAALLATFSSIRLIPGFSASPALVLLLAGLLVGLGASTVCATWWADGRAAWNGFWHVTGLILFGRIAVELCKWPSVARAMFMLLMISSLMLSVHSVHQVFISFPETREQYQLDPERTLSELQINAPPGSPMRNSFEARLNSSEPIASFALTNSLAVVLSASLVALGLLVTSGWISKTVPVSVVVLYGIAAVFMVVVWFLTKSRTAYLAVLIVVLASIAIVRQLQRRTSQATAAPARSRKGLLIGGTLFGLIMFVGLLSLLSSDLLILSEAPKSLGYRIEYWRATSKLISDHWLTGVGLGNFQSYYPRYKIPEASEVIADPHNWMFDIAACCSLPVFLLATAGLVWMVWLSLERIGQQVHSIEVDDGTLSAGPHAPGDALDKQLAKGLAIGAAAGWVFTVGTLLLVKEAIDLDATILGLIIAAAIVVPASAHWKPKEAPLRGAALAASAAMVVCLLASGSWQASGIALPLSAWLAISCASRREFQSASPVKNPWPARAIALGLSFAFLFQTWRPVNNSWVKEQQAQYAALHGNWNEGIEALHQSIAMDSIDPLRYRLLIQFMIERESRAIGDDFESTLKQVQSAIDQLLRCDGTSYLNWNLSGDNMISLAALAHERQRKSGHEALQLALTYYMGAVQRYPSSSQIHAQLALVHWLLEHRREAVEEARIAISLSDETPHADRKLAMQQIWLPSELTRLPELLVVRPTSKSSWVQAEPICQFIVKQ